MEERGSEEGEGVGEENLDYFNGLLLVLIMFLRYFRTWTFEMSLPQPNDTSHKQVTTSNHNSLRFLVRLFVHSSFHSPHHISCMTSFVLLFFFFLLSVCLSYLPSEVRGPRSINTTLDRGNISQARLPRCFTDGPTIFSCLFYFFLLNYIFYYLFIYLFICLFHFYFYFICTLLSPSSYLQLN